MPRTPRTDAKYAAIAARQAAEQAHPLRQAVEDYLDVPCQVLVVEVVLEGDAFGATAESQADQVARILHELASTMRAQGTVTPSHTMRDTNGNTCGSLRLEEGL